MKKRGINQRGDAKGSSVRAPPRSPVWWAPRIDELQAPKVNTTEKTWTSADTQSGEDRSPDGRRVKHLKQPTNQPGNQPGPQRGTNIQLEDIPPNDVGIIGSLTYPCWICIIVIMCVNYKPSRQYNTIQYTACFKISWSIYIRFKGAKALY